MAKSRLKVPENDIQLTLFEQQKPDLFGFDRALREECGVVCGIDEAGRGPLAGDVYAAAVIFPENVVIEGLDDSKKLTEKMRERLFEEIREKAAAFCIASASVEEIERLNILQATFLAMQRAYEGLKIPADIVLIDGNRMPPFNAEKRCVVKGDGTSASIAAASVLAKVSRDRYMEKMAELYPQYGFEKHKGYGTKAHYLAVEQYGLCEIHRKSFFEKFFAKRKAYG